MIRRYPKVFVLFDRLFFSHRLCQPQAGPDRVTGDLGASGEEIVFVDDSPANVAAALGAGWHALPFRGAASLRHDLHEAAERLRR